MFDNMCQHVMICVEKCDMHVCDDMLACNDVLHNKVCMCVFDNMCQHVMMS